MRLAAMWVEDFMKIRNKGFNFGGRLTFDFEFDHNRKKLYISARETPEYFDLFSESSVENISGIIGTNGSGKTTLLRLLNTLDARKPLLGHVVTIWQKGDMSYTINDYIKENDFYKKNVLEIVLNKSGLFSEDDIESNKIEIVTHKGPLTDLNLIFYSNLYANQNDNFLNKDNPLNRSVDYQTIKSLSRERLQQYINSHKESDTQRKLFNDENYNPLSLYQYDRIGRLISFLAQAKNGLQLHFKDEITFPETIPIWFNEAISERVFRLSEQSMYDFSNIYKFYDKCFSVNKEEQSAKQKFKNAVVYNLFFSAVYNDFFKKSNEGGELADIEDFISNLVLDNTMFDKIREFMIRQKSAKGNYPIDRIRELLTDLDILLESTVITEERSFVSGFYELSIDDNLWEFISRILRILDFRDEAIFNVNVAFSAGETAILGQFSEFYEAFTHITKKNILVIIDEGELYLHPEWQRKYINALYMFFDYYAKKHNITVQIIVTSHSPFIVSDIPKFNLVYLNKDDYGLTAVQQSEEQKPTLGGNVFELFQDGFYMNEFIGEFAFTKINDAIDFLNDRPSTFKNLHEVERFVLLIGENIIRRELQRVIELKKIQDLGTYYETAKEDSITVVDKTNKKKK